MTAETPEQMLRAMSEFMKRHGDQLDKIRERVLWAIDEVQKVKDRDAFTTEEIQEQCPELSVDDVEFTLILMRSEGLVDAVVNHKTKSVVWH